jgi:transcriptional regulator with XRE-family HTH domain
MHDTMKIDPARLKRMREARGWTQEQLAEMAGLNARTVQRVEASGKASAETGMALASVLACSLSDLSESLSPRDMAPAPGQVTQGGSKQQLLLHLLWMTLIVTMFVIVTGWKFGKDIAAASDARELDARMAGCESRRSPGPSASVVSRPIAADCPQGRSDAGDP